MADTPSLPRHRPGGDPDPESDDDDFTVAVPRRMTLGMRLVYIVVLLIVAGMITYLVLIVLYPEQFASRSWIGAKAPPKSAAAIAAKAKRGFELGGVWLGMTPVEARAIFPAIRFEPAADGGSVGVFPHHDGEYRVSFHGASKGERAYRIASRHAYAKASYLELLSELAGKYGKPRASACTAEEGTVAIQCALQWDLSDAALDAQIRTAAPPGGGESQTTLTVTATDLRPDEAFATPAPPGR